MKQGDKLVLALLAGVFLLSGLYITWLNQAQGGELIATVSSDGKTIREIALGSVKEPFTFRVEAPNGGYNIIAVEEGRIRVTEADCPEQVDVRQGWISAPHESIVCLPNRLVISLAASGKGDIDFIVR